MPPHLDCKEQLCLHLVRKINSKNMFVCICICYECIVNIENPVSMSVPFGRTVEQIFGDKSPKGNPPKMKQNENMKYDFWKLGPAFFYHSDFRNEKGGRSCRKLSRGNCMLCIPGRKFGKVVANRHEQENPKQNIIQ